MIKYSITVEGEDAADREEIEHRLDKFTYKCSALSNECAVSWQVEYATVYRDMKLKED